MSSVLSIKELALVRDTVLNAGKLALNAGF